MFGELKRFMQEDLWIPASFIAVLLLIKAWKEGDLTEAFVVLLFYGLVMAVTKGPQILAVVGWFLRLFGIETGL